VFGFAAFEIGNAKAGPVGFVLARLAAGEAEILTIVVARSHRRRGSAGS
jgi:ribosomal-protein-alanine N-acetyltransferase